MISFSDVRSAVAGEWIVGPLGGIAMKFHLFEKHSEVYLRKSREYLEEANLARVEHQAAAEHHAALAKMYTERISRIEGEIDHVLRPRSLAIREPAREPAAAEEAECAKPEGLVVYPSRAARP